MQDMRQVMQDALTPSLTLSPYEDHICEFCNEIVPPKFIALTSSKGITKQVKVQPRCRCEVDDMEKGQKDSEELKHKRDIETRFAISSLGERFAQSTFESFDKAIGTEQALMHCRNFAKSFPDYGGDALLIWGPYGNGKSHLAAAIAHFVQAKGFTVVFQTLPELLERIRATFGDRKDKETEKDIMYALQNCQLLVLDDVGAEKVTDWVQDALFRIVDGRYRQKRPILYTTNLKPSEIKDKVGPRIYDRMVETSLMVENSGTSFRMKVAENRFRSMKDRSTG